MEPAGDMSRVVNGKRYAVATAELIASDCYWDGSNFERHGRNTFLYRTPNGAFFVVRMSQWQGERHTLEPINEATARDLYENDLPEHALEWEDVFGPAEEA